VFLSRLNEYNRTTKSTGDRICRTLLKIYEKKYLLDPTAIKLKTHIPAINFSKQSYRNSFPNRSFNLECDSRLSDINWTKKTLISKKIRGLIPMSKQLARRPQPTPHYGPTYKLNYNQVFPKIQIKVDYDRQTKNKPSRGRIPLIIPLLPKSTTKNKSLIL